VKVIVCGLGSIGMRHARNLHSLGVVHIIGVDPSPERQAKFHEQFGGDVQADLTADIANVADLAVIASPNRFHIEQALLCAENQCHLFIEKPLGVREDGIEKLIALIDDGDLFAHVGSNWKFHPAFIQMKTLLDENTIGKVSGCQVLAG